MCYQYTLKYKRTTILEMGTGWSTYIFAHALNINMQKYSKDIRGGGYSGQPFIKRSIPETRNQLNSLSTEALSLDYPIRGGSYEELAAREDFARIDRFLLSYPQGKAFLDKQIKLVLAFGKIKQNIKKSM